MSSKPGPFEAHLSDRKEDRESGSFQASNIVNFCKETADPALLQPILRRLLNDNGHEQVSNGGSRNNLAIIRPGAEPSIKAPLDRLDSSDAKSPYRNFACCNYETCLSLAAALDWESFTCQDCNETINSQLLWRAHHKIRGDGEMEDFCKLPELKKELLNNDPLQAQVNLANGTRVVPFLNPKAANYKTKIKG